MTDSERDVLLTRVDTTVNDLKEGLIGEQGRIPKLEAAKDEHAKQINFWRGALALIAFLLLTFGGVLLAHVMGGK
jgi:hypothetical protein